MMQALWSRAAQTRSSCRCSACLHAATAIARRSTTAASRRRLKVGDLFTACYSTIFGTAVFADAKIKQERRNEWDRAIAEAKAGIPMDEPRGVERTESDISHTQDWPGVVKLRPSDKKIAIQRPQVLDGTGRITSEAPQNDPLHTTLDLHTNKSLQSTTDSRLYWPPKVKGGWPDEANTTSDAFLPPREPLTRFHVDKMEEMMSRLVTQILIRRKELSTLQTSPVAKINVSLRLKEIMNRIESLQTSNTRLPSYTFHDTRAAAKERWQLNRSIERLFDNTAKDYSNIDFILAKICYNLLVSATPPNIETYNVLIRSLTRLRLHHLAQVVVNSFLFESKFKPTSTTVQLLLYHYSAQKDLAGFRAVVNRMRAVDGDMRMGKRGIDSLGIPQVQTWAMTRKVLQRGGYLREKIPRDSNIFDSLINGYLEFDKVRAAVRYLRAALNEGVQVSSITLLRVVNACTCALDYATGLSLLRALLRQWERRSGPTIVYSGQARLAVHRLFGLCGIKPSLDSTRPLPRNVSRAAVQNLQYHMAIRSLEDTINKFAALVIFVEDILVNGNRHDKSARFSKALAILRSGSHIERLRSSRRDANNEQAAILRVENPMVSISWLNAQYRKLCIKRQEMYNGVIKHNPGLCWSDRLEILSHYCAGKDISPGHPLHRAVLKWEIWKYQEQRQTREAKIPRDTTTMKQTIKFVDGLEDQQHSTVQLPSQPKQPKKAYPRKNPHAPSLPRTPGTVVLALPLAQNHDSATLELMAR